MFQPKSFGTNIRPVLLIHFLCGIGSPAYLMKHQVKKSAEIAYTVWSLAIFHLLLYHEYCCLAYFRGSKIGFYTKVSCMWICCSYIIILVVIIAPRFNKENVQNMIAVTEEIDQKMDTIGLPKQHRSQCKYEMGYFFLSLVQISIILLTQWYFSFNQFVPIYHKILLTLTTNIVPILTMTTQLSFCVWLRYIRMKFSQLNYLMEEMIDSSGPKRFLEISDYQIKRRRCLNVRLVKGNVQIITKAKECHLDLIKIARRVNKFYGVNILSSLVTSIITVMIMLYIINFSMWLPLSAYEFCVETFPMAVWILLTSMRMIHLHINCMQTSNEVGKAAYLLCRLYDSSTSMQFRIEVQQFAQQVQQNPLVLNICGLVDIDDTFLTSTVAWIFTYIVIILQLQTQSLQQKLDANLTFVSLSKN